ncbi:MAG TPA: hypothetical protein VJZ76_20035 [Thermoanaerobaculia bacterium]|nr:hypothetical protein [Thermoanaerobaculia bacterium]
MIVAALSIAAAQLVFDNARIASAEDAGKLWGKPLYGPMIIVDRNTRDFVRNDGTNGTLPKETIVANTASMLDGKLTTMIALQSLGDTAVQQRRLAMHECWHRIQNDLGFPASNPNNAHLDTLDGRVSLQLELRALSAALRSTGDARMAAIRDAVAFRSARRAQFKEAGELERALENNEGLAEYTGVALRGTPADESRLVIAREIEHVDPKTSFVRGFAYLTGPAYGLLLDELKPGWTRTYKVTDDLAAVTGVDGGVARPQQYGGAELRAAEEKRDREQRDRVARYRSRLVDGPVLELPMIDAHFGFDPNAVIPLGDAGNAYPTLDVTAPWGHISVDRGARIPNDWSKIVVAAEERGKLELKPSCKLVPGKRDGDWRVSCE